LGVQETKEILAWMEYLVPKDHQDQEDDEVQLVPPVCLVCQDGLELLEAEDLRVIEAWLDLPVTMVVMDPMDLLVTLDEVENLVQQVQKDFLEELVAMDLEANEDQQERLELQDRVVDKEKSEQLAKKVLSELLEKLEQKEQKVIEAWMVYLVRWEDQELLENQGPEEEKVNVVPLDPWVTQEELDFQEAKDHEVQWDAVECQADVEFKESQVQWEQKDQVVLVELLVNWENLVQQVEMVKQENLVEMEHQEKMEHPERWEHLDEKDILDLLEFQDIQDHPALLENAVMLADQAFQAKTEHLDQLELKDQ